MCAISGTAGLKIVIISLLLLLIYILQYTTVLKDTYSSVFNNIVTKNADNSTVDHYRKQNRTHIKANENANIEKLLPYKQMFTDMHNFKHAGKNSRKSQYNSILKGPLNVSNGDVYLTRQDPFVNVTSFNSNKGEQYDLINKQFFIHNRNVKDINCHGIIDGRDLEINRALSINVKDIPLLAPKHYIEITKNCTSFINDRGYITHHLTEEERNFPIAYSILMYKNAEQAERLLRAIYRPQNIYCIHVDSKTNDMIYMAMSSIANCFQNVFLLNERVNVKWGKISVLEPELLCMEQLWRRDKTWKYFINLTGQEFPLKTNYELVQILKAYNGSNDVESTVTK
ncbi:beta-1,3-galactosyl-O-glycosyl-glycoprotein beta-1,6-N-acetylglucosaminyltransferase-like [Mercenaria mercenaria]|uniref:beta-1,3-galactosyl-O-glycosyl-glycoprotein beta-1,6-N-acetylglucosaminyltransferase-like n=1 Tax=Mercenaria mercenaria TaxID=6596 RepID=UPI00234FAC24|nr:beta-1,3-galactosyl-O-glycosyl-glycoprotein beta-1,6-N-acetylglucosaminyltransferase-like [Mercenaria mercenaria]